MSELKTTGKIFKIFDTVQVTEKFCKREFVLELEGKYPEFVKFQMVQDKCEWLDKYVEQEMVTVFFNIKGKPYTNKEGVQVFFTNLDCWKIEGEKAQKAPAPEPKLTKEEVKMAGIDIESNLEEEDLPF